jgi:acyl-CoA synthetase (AMP-forming)/AMP-acid ligase II/aryl carrier-like protein
MATALLAIASCATCAPLNPACTAEEFELFLNDLRPDALILPAGADSPAARVARRLGIHLIEANADSTAAAGIFDFQGTTSAPTRREPDYAHPDDIALVLYTSGTTSRPKQIPLTHANLCASARNVATSLQLSPNDRCLNILPLFHIHGIVAAVLASLTAGGSVACTPGFAGDRFFEWLDALDPTWYTAVPTMHQAILDGAATHQEIIQRRRLRFIRSSSAALPAHLAAELERCLGAPVIEAYGMTEAAHQVTGNPLPPAIRKPKSVGIAAGLELTIMDEEGRELPLGAIGEIVIRGNNVTRGYTNDPEANAAAFVAGWFHTGDQGFVDADGYVYITGRLKEIINRGGKKFSPREVEEALVEHAAVSQAAAFRVSHATLGEDVAAAVVLKDGVRTNADEIRACLFGRLADFKVPSQIVVVERLPTTATGKVERNRLERVLTENLKATFAPPRDSIEAQVAAIFSQLLEVSEVGVHDNFFVLGGDSLRGFQALARIRAQLKADLSILDLFKHPTVAQLAREVARARESAKALALRRILGEVERLSENGAVRRAKGGPHGS